APERAPAGLDRAALGVITTSNAIEISAPPQRIYALAAATERWPELLPHYRFVRVLERRSGNARVVEMAARRDWIPVRWVAEQENDPATPRIRFRHIAGATRGMEVEWRFEPSGSRTLVSIEHWWNNGAARLVSDWVVRHVICEFFIHDIANKTLAQVKRLAEAGR
ncbi:MAG: type II toxin-antitoxin system RatA family toxin, partial [Vulcanimicrobiaceae bacterium]